MSDASTVESGAAKRPAPPSKDERRHQLRLTAARFALPAILVIFVVFFSLERPDTFGTSSNFETIIITQSVLGILAIGLLLPLVVGEFDLSVAAVLGLGVVLVTGLMSKSGVALVPAIVITLAVCSGIGLINGLLVARVGLNSLVTTLAMSTIVTGGVEWYTNGNVISEHIPKSFHSLTAGSVFGLPLPGFYLLVVAVVVWFILEQTAVGRYLYATGGSRESSRLAGLNISRLTVAAFVVAGFLAGAAGIVQASLVNSGSPTVGPPFLLQAFAAVFLGATSIRLGVFNVVGTVIAIFTLAAGITGLQLMGAAFYIAPVFQGVALLIAVAAVRWLRREAS